jgi:hypothetical protein
LPQWWACGRALQKRILILERGNFRPRNGQLEPRAGIPRLRRRLGQESTTGSIEENLSLDVFPRGIDRESEISDDQLHSAAHPRVVWITVISSGPTGSAHQSPAVNRPPKVVIAVIGLTAAARMARDRRTHERVILLAIVLAAAVDVAREGKVRSVTRLIAWDRQRTLAQQRQVKAPRS